MGLVVGVDVATAQVRALAADSAGRPRAEARRALPEPRSPQPGWWEQDAGAWWPAVAGALSELTGRLRGSRRSVAAISVCATSGTVVALDRHASPVTAALTYADQRAVSQAEMAQDAGAPRWARLGLRVQPSFGLPKWAWLLDRPDVVSSTARLAHAPDVVVGRLLGTTAPTDWSHALKSGYDPQRQEWAGEVMEALGISGQLLPEVARPTEAVGRVSREAAQTTGLPESCEVRLGMTDSCAAQMAAGAGAPGRFVSVLGSTLVLKGVSHALVGDPDGAVYSHRHPDGWWLPGGASSTGARALTVEFPRRDLADLDDRAAHHGPARVVAYPLVGRGERFPFAVADAEGFVLGEPAGEVQRYRAILEGVAFVERLGYERLVALGATVNPPITVTGGGSTSRVWNRIRSAVLGIPLVEKPAATTALGACILAAAGTLHPDLATAVEAMTGGGAPVQGADEAERGALEDGYGRFVAEVRRRGWLPPDRVGAGADVGKRGRDRP